MNWTEILRSIDSEIERLTRARTLLASSEPGKRRGRPPGSGNNHENDEAASPTKRRVVSEAGKARIAAAQKARWAKKKAAK